MCPQDELQCGNGQCISKALFCDEQVDCQDGSDENACGVDQVKLGKNYFENYLINIFVRIPIVPQNVIPEPVSCLTVSVPRMEQESLEILIQTKYLK